MRVVGGIEVASVAKIAFDDGAKARLEEQLAGQPVEQRRVARDGRDEQRCAGPGHPQRLAQRGDSIRRLRQVIHRPEQQHRVHRAVVEGQLGGHPEGCFDGACGRLQRACRLDVVRRRIHQMNAMAVFGQPRRVDAGGAADICDVQRLFGKEAADQLLGADELELTQAADDPGALIDLGIVLQHFFRNAGHVGNCVGAGDLAQPI